MAFHLLHNLPRGARASSAKPYVSVCDSTTARRVLEFHKTVPQYSPTPLVSLNCLSEKLGLDESKRFGLNAFKALGGTWAVANIIAKKISFEGPLDFESLVKATAKILQDKASSLHKELQDLTFITATDGNHGRGIAWAAQQFQCKAEVYMPEGSAESRIRAIENHGAKVTVINGNYDIAVSLAAKKASELGWVLVQDTAWEGYEDIPKLVMQGYATIIEETFDQLESIHVDTISHVFVQCGVGSLASSLASVLESKFSEKRPIFVLVEPDKANCVYLSFKNGKLSTVTGSLDTIMAGLACGVPSSIGWPILQELSDVYASCDDYVSRVGTFLLAHPQSINGKQDPVVVSGESGSVGLGLLALISRDIEVKQLLKLDHTSRVLVVSTEGDTDPTNYAKIISDAHNNIF